MRQSSHRRGAQAALATLIAVLAAGPLAAQVLLSDDFEDGDLAQWERSGSSVGNSTAEASQGSRSLQNAWSLRQNYSRATRSFPSTSTTYLRLYWKGSPGFTFTASGDCPTEVAQKKFVELNGGEYASRLGVFLEPTDRCGHAHTEARMKWVTTGSGVGESWNMFPNGSCTACPPGGHRNLSTNPEIRLTGGRWYCIEIAIQQVGAGQAAGSQVQVWVDGTLQIDVRDELLGAATNWISLDGEHNGGVEQAQTEWFDNIVVSTQRIGCGAAPPPGNATLPSVTGLHRTDTN